MDCVIKGRKRVGSEWTMRHVHYTREMVNSRRVGTERMGNQAILRDWVDSELSSLRYGASRECEKCNLEMRGSRETEHLNPEFLSSPLPPLSSRP